jgi:DNA-binding CsgD family transcriptional regulator
MIAGVGGVAAVRADEFGAITEVLTAVDTFPVGVIVEGAAGIGKTTLWAEAVQWAAAAGFHVLSAQGSPAEARSTFAAAADLLADVDADVLAALPPLQQVALDRILLRGNGGPATDERVVGTAFLSVIEQLAGEAPVLLAIDDLQWLDVASRTVVSFAARRLKANVAMLMSVRTGELDSPDAGSWLQLSRPDALIRIELPPLSLGGLHAVIANKIGRTLPRIAIGRIHQISGGNPFYGLELARAFTDDAPGTELKLPGSLAGVVSRRIGDLDVEAAELLLATACASDPTTDLLSEVFDVSTERVLELLEDVETQGVVELRNSRVRFTHPLLANGVYSQASRSRRRAMHRRLAGIVDEPELRARHLALAATTTDAPTLEALDAAAQIAADRGAPGSAAELIDLAIGLGGDTPLRRIRAAELHFRAGSLTPARLHLQPTIDVLPSGVLRCLALMLLGAVRGYDDDAVGAVEALIQAFHDAEDDTELRLRCVLRLVAGLVMVGRIGEAVDHARIAMALADRLGVPGLRSQALSVWVTVGFVYGLGVDHRSLQTAVELEDPQGDATTWYLASAVQAMISAWTGELALARTQMLAVQRRMLEGGTEIDVIWAANHLATIDVWSGRFIDADAASRDAVQRAEQMGGRHLLVTAWSWQAEVAAYVGREAEARSAAGHAIAAARQIGASYLVTAPTASLAFLEVSLGNYDSALIVLEPLLAAFDAAHHTEIVLGGYLPDAIEALVALGRLDEAEPLVTALRDNGARLDRAWMSAVGARGWAHLCAARADLDGADEALREALTFHERLPMPFEQARTQLLLGQLQRRQRRKEAAAATLQTAMRTFEAIGAPLWADRARTALARTNVSPGTEVDLTPTERQVADLAASGVKNRDVAAELFISVKTVEANLTNVYRKLGIRSRAQLFAHLNATDARENPNARQ